MFERVHLALWLFLCAFPNFLQANTLTIHEAVSRLESNNPQLQSYHEKIRAKKAQTTHRSTLPNPTVSYMHMNDPLRGPITQMYGEQIAIKQKIPFPSKLFTAGTLGKRRVALAEEEYNSVHAKLVRDLRTVYYHLKKLTGVREWIQKEIVLLETFEQSATGQIAAGLGKGYQLYRSRLFLTSARQELIELDEQVARLQSQMNALLAVSGEVFELEAFNEQFIEYGLPDLQQLIELSTQDAPKRRVAHSKLDVAKVEASLAGQSWMPNMGLLGAYTFRADTPGINTSDQWSVGVEIEFPLWFAFQDIPKYQEKAREKLSIEHQLRQADLDAEQVIRSLYAEYQKVREILSLLQKEYLPITKAIQESAQVELSVGRISFDDYIEAMLEHIQKQKAWQKMRADYEVTLAKIAYQIGKPKEFVEDLQGVYP